MKEVSKNILSVLHNNPNGITILFIQNSLNISDNDLRQFFSSLETGGYLNIHRVSSTDENLEYFKKSVVFIESKGVDFLLSQSNNNHTQSINIHGDNFGQLNQPSFSNTLTNNNADTIKKQVINPPNPKKNIFESVAAIITIIIGLLSLCITYYKCHS